MATTAISDRSIAVLPFVDMSEKKDQEYFSDGLSEQLIDMLTQIPDLRVPARTSSFYFKARSEDIPTIARRLLVAHVLEGSVRKSGQQLRITAQLVRADNGYHVWSETYDRRLDDVFKIQDEIAAAVVRALKLRLLDSPSSRDRRTANPEAYNQYLIGRQFFVRGNWEDYRRAMQAYRKAVLSAFVDVENALVALAKFTLQEKLQTDVVNASRKAFDVSETQYRGGTVNLLTVLQTEQTLFTAENTLVQVRLSKLLAASSLFQALGGGWTPDGLLASLQPRGQN